MTDKAIKCSICDEPFSGDGLMTPYGPLHQTCYDKAMGDLTEALAEQKLQDEKRAFWLRPTESK